jgi:hypothetical protein
MWQVTKEMRRRANYAKWDFTRHQLFACQDQLLADVMAWPLSDNLDTSRLAASPS